MKHITKEEYELRKKSFSLALGIDVPVPYEDVCRLIDKITEIEKHVSEIQKVIITEKENVGYVEVLMMAVFHVLIGPDIHIVNSLFSRYLETLTHQSKHDEQVTMFEEYLKQKDYKND